MAQTDLQLGAFESYLKKIFPMQYAEEKTWSKHGQLLSKFGLGDFYCNGQTVYSAYNAVTEILTHNLGKDNRSRFYSNNWGSNSTYHNRAFDFAVKML